jgi:hypothetical protein
MFSIDDSLLYVSQFSDICTRCKHLNECLILEKVKTCRAFPKGILDEIWVGENNHKRPYRGNNGIQFELHPRAVR